MVYCDIVTRIVKIIQSVAYDNYMMIFNMSTSYFHQNSFLYFEENLMT
jgi:hypothetical protein